MSLAELEERRLQAASLFEQGVKQARVAELFGVSRQAVSQWFGLWREGGSEALLAGPHGAPAYLTYQQERELLGIIEAGPQACGWEDQRWTLARVGRVIRERFAVSYELSGVWRLLDRLEVSWQVPVVRAVQRDEEAIAAWPTETWPAASHPRRRELVRGGSASRTRPARG